MKAIIPAAGLGTRMLPVTKVVPKELLPVRGKPAIQWVLEEAKNAGLTEFLVIVNPRKAILREYLTALNKGHPLSSTPELDRLERLLNSVKISFVEQPEPLGLGDALLRCRDLIEDQPFALLLPDNVFSPESRLLHRLLESFTSYDKSLMALWNATGIHLSYGAVAAVPYCDSIYLVRRVLSKQEGSETTRLRAVGRSVLHPAALQHLARAQSSGELDDAPLFNGLAQEELLLGLLTDEEFVHLGVAAR